MELLFDSYDRTMVGPSNYQTPTYEFLNQTAESRFSKIRDTLESWYGCFPVSGRTEFLGRFRSNDNRHFLGALLELFTHRLFSVLGFQVTRTDGACDFLASSNEREFLIECTLSGDPLANEMADQHVNLICDKLDVLKSRFFINLLVSKIGSQSPADGKLVRWLDKKINEITNHQIKNEFFEEDTAVNWMFNTNGWQIEISLISKNKATEDSKSMGIIVNGPAQFISSERFLFNALHDKRQARYGEMVKPYVIVVNSLDPTIDETSIIQTLFDTNSNAEYGFFGNSNNKKNTSVSGVLVLKGLYAMSIANPTIAYWLNPWAKYPLELPFDTQYLTSEERRFNFDSVRGLTAEEIWKRMR